ncbi:MAG: hypothetical protein ACREVI_01215 [Steroidobacteraceae bacterium]
MNRLSAILFATSLAGACATTGSLDSAATRLDSSAQRFYEQIDSRSFSGRTADDAARLAEATRDFEMAVDGARSRDELRPRFERVSERYHNLREQVEDGDPMYRRQDVAFERVTDAYLDVDRMLNHGDDHDHDDHHD